MAKRRGHGEGSIYKRDRDGKWCAVLDLGRAPDGRRLRRTATADTRQQAARKLFDLQRQAEQQTLLVGRDTTLEQWLQRWLTDHIDHRVTLGSLRSSTAAAYRQHVRDHITPCIGAVRLTKLRPTHVRQLHTALIDKGLAATTAARVHATLRKSLADAEREEIVTSNVASKVPAPTGTPREPTPLPLDQARALLAHEPGEPWHIAFVLMLTCGLRVGETLALRWSDLDLTTGALTVRRQVRRQDGELIFGPPKSARSRRTILMPPVATEALYVHRREQRRRRIKAMAWDDADLIVTTTIGTVVDHSNLWRRWKQIRDDLDIARTTRLHDLRHSAASLALLGGVPLRAVADFLGHSQISVTADTYSHVLNEMKQQTADRLDNILRAKS